MKLKPLMKSSQPEGTTTTTPKGDILIVYKGDWYFKDELEKGRASINKALSSHLVVRSPSNQRNQLVGQTFNLLSVIEYAHSDKRGRAYWLTECQCGHQAVVRGQYITSGRTKGCRSCSRKHKENKHE